MAVDDAHAPAKKRCRRATESISGISSLPEHLQQEIFLRVGDIKALFMFAVTSRGWLRRFTDPTFLRELCPRHGGNSRHGARVLGVWLQCAVFDPYDKVMVQARMAPQQQQGASSMAAPTFLPALGSPLGARRLVDGDAAFDYAELLAARRGIVLVRLAPRTPAEMDSRPYLFAVCNPVTGHRHVLPPPEWSLSEVRGYAIVTAADSPQLHPPAAAHFTFSRLLVIAHHRQAIRGDAYLHSYSAATRSWSAPTMCLDRGAMRAVTVCDWSAVVHRGAAHWLCVDIERYHLATRARGRGRGDDDRHMYMLSVDVATARASLTRLPVRVGGNPLLYVTGDGNLAVATVYMSHVTVWTESPASTAPAWLRTSFLMPAAAPAVPYPPPQLRHQENWRNFNHGSLIAVFRGSKIFILDIDTKAMEKVSVLDFHSKAMISLAAANWQATWVPYEMDVVEFFMVQLGGIRDRLGPTISEIQSP
jgi:hypothetical protein